MESKKTYRGHNYLEIDCIADNTMMASSITKSAYSLSSNIVVDIAYVIEGCTSDELPERCFATFTILNLNVDNALRWSKPNEKNQTDDSKNKLIDVDNETANDDNTQNNGTKNNDESDDDQSDLLAALELD